MKSLIIVALVLGSIPALAMNCKAQFEYLDKNNLLQRKVADFTVRMDDVGLTVFESRIENVYYEVQQSKGEESLLSMITLGPNYDHGVAVRGAWDSNGIFRITRVDGQNVYRIECLR